MSVRQWALLSRNRDASLVLRTYKARTLATRVEICSQLCHHCLDQRPQRKPKAMTSPALLFLSSNTTMINSRRHCRKEVNLLSTRWSHVEAGVLAGTHLYALMMSLFIKMMSTEVTTLLSHADTSITSFLSSTAILLPGSFAGSHFSYCPSPAAVPALTSTRADPTNTDGCHQCLFRSPTKADAFAAAAEPSQDMSWSRINGH